MRNQFITFEGGEGSGKSTQINLLHNFLIEKGKDVVSTREPGGTPSAEIIRDLLTKGDADRWSPATEALLMWAARSEHVEKLIKPSLDKGKWVLCDRFYHSTYAYQGVGHNLGIENMRIIKKIIIGEITPNLTFILDIDPVNGIGRTKNRVSNEDRFEKMNLAFHNNLRKAFIQLAKKNPKRFIVIDAELSLEKISEIISSEVQTRFQL
jgi:dTMP kinase